MYSAVVHSSCVCPVLFLLEPSSKSVVQVWTINGAPVAKIIVEDEVSCLAYSAAPEGLYINVLAGGLKNGKVK